MDIRKEKMISIALIMEKDNYIINETINRRINKYDFQDHTSITHNDKQIIIHLAHNLPHHRNKRLLRKKTMLIQVQQNIY